MCRVETPFIFSWPAPLSLLSLLFFAYQRGIKYGNLLGSNKCRLSHHVTPANDVAFPDDSGPYFSIFLLFFFFCFFCFIGDVYRKSLPRLASFKIKRHAIFIIFYYFGSSAVSLSSARFTTGAAMHKSQVIWALLSLR